MFSLVVVRVHLASQNKLSDVAGTFDRLRLLLGFGQSWEEQSRQDGDYGDHDQQFNQGKGAGDLRIVSRTRRSK